MSNVTVTSKFNAETNETWWRMEYGGQVDYVDEEPTEAQKRNFVQSVAAQRRREQVEANLPKLPEGYQPGRVERA